uniref:NADH dehydrogenase subunit 4L n=1 Tax=Ulva meridionalis TaxID=434723 RepID=UPI002113A72E|nr:NADH dehydrogenase subunit 4L [Ulva meridionalis]UTA96528.1 NADH dehydrogenase subunit 4L [Ulva meridionalis]UTA96586.1 NADH dehydrogenase subunit 4L [Ulva meridionalis]UTA96638.1 NADH dehydrogenase subunit 4L [Ulva meridionalis]UTA96690.1 NADH dehydrogenase subunit 4L [Ulva meridionalis]UTA96753.1 NADH dehydrogenase subunit 4L [Ulva meridionalis]
MIIEKMNNLMPSLMEANLSTLLWQPSTFPGSDTFNQLIITGFIVFWIGLTGIFFNRRLVISILLAVELTLLSINLLMLTFAAAMEDLVGVMFALYILCVAAAESAIGLALIIIWYRVRRTVSVQYISLLKG